MFGRLLVFLITALTMGVCSGRVSAGCPTPETWPDVVTASSTGGLTSITFGPPSLAAILNHRITVVGNDVTIAGDFVSGCGIGVPPPFNTQTLRIGALLPGTYQLRMVYENFPGTTFVVRRTFVVGAAGSAVAAVPFLTNASTVLLAAMFGLVAMLSIRRGR